MDAMLTQFGMDTRVPVNMAVLLGAICSTRRIKTILAALVNCPSFARLKRRGRKKIEKRFYTVCVELKTRAL
jgi:hypothetical protein